MTDEESYANNFLVPTTFIFDTTWSMSRPETTEFKDFILGHGDTSLGHIPTKEPCQPYVVSLIDDGSTIEGQI